jgi:hypothetical protein
MERTGLSKLTRAIACVLILAFPSAVFAEDERLIPAWQECLVDGQRYACFDLEDTRALLVLETKARSWQRQIGFLREQRDSLTLIVNIKEDQIKDLNSTLELYVKRNEELTNQLLEEIEKKNEYKAKAESSPFLPWLIGGLVLALGAAFGAGIYVAKR